MSWGVQVTVVDPKFIVILQFHHHVENCFLSKQTNTRDDASPINRYLSLGFTFLR